jgi:beta-galactosidase
MIKESFNENWTYCPGSGTALEKTIHGEVEKEKVTLPHDAMIHQLRDRKAAGGNAVGYYPCVSASYEKTFEVTELYGSVYLEFEGIYKDASVHLNGSLLADHHNGYLPLKVDVSSLLKKGDNTIRVLCRNSSPSSRWYCGSGIYRDVWMHTGEKLHIRPDGVRLTVLEADEKMACIFIETTIMNRHDCQIKTELTHEIAKTKISTPVSLQPHESKTVNVRFYLKEPRLWSVDDPYMYECKSELTGCDSIVTRFGIRTLNLDSARGLRINGSPILLRGGCIHQDHGILGGIEHKEMTYRRIRKLKEAGYNAIRCAHFPTSKTVLDACDELGMLVILELCDAWTTPKVEDDYAKHFKEDFLKDSEAMVLLAYNHPSVIIYSMGNEISEVKDPNEVQYGRMIADKIRSMDHSRYVTNCINIILAMMDRIPQLAIQTGADINSIMNGDMGELYKVLSSKEMGEPLQEAFSYLDIAGYNYASFRYETDMDSYPHRIILGTECYPGSLYDNWQQCQKYPQLIGDFGWSAWDYLGEAGVGQHRYGEADGNDLYGKYPWRSAYCGDFDLIGDRRPVSYWRQIVWGLRKKPYIASQDPAHYGEKQSPTKWGWTDAKRCWNYRGYEGKPIVIEVYSDSDEVELYLNGRLIGKERPEHCKAYFTATFKAGELKAVNIKDGQKAEEDRIVSASYDVHLEHVETAKGIHEFSVVDENGILNPDIDLTVTLKPGSGTSVLGFGSADPLSEEDYFNMTIRTWQGRALAVTSGNGQLETEVENEVFDSN